MSWCTINATLHARMGRPRYRNTSKASTTASGATRALAMFRPRCSPKNSENNRRRLETRVSAIDSTPQVDSCFGDVAIPDCEKHWRHCSVPTVLYCTHTTKGNLDSRSPRPKVVVFAGLSQCRRRASECRPWSNSGDGSRLRYFQPRSARPS